MRGGATGTAMSRKRYGSMKKARRGSAYKSARKIVVYSKSSELNGMDTELNVMDQITNIASGTTDIVPLNLVRTGNGSWNRSGKKITLDSVRIFGELEANFTPGATTANYFGLTYRLALVWDKQPSGNTLPAFNDIFGTTDQAGTESTDIFDPIKYDNTGRFTLLWDHKECLNPPALTSGGSGNDYKVKTYVDKYVKLGGKETIFGGNSSPMTIADISTGGLYLIARASENNADSNIVADTKFKARLRYYM